MKKNKDYNNSTLPDHNLVYFLKDLHMYTLKQLKNLLLGKVTVPTKQGTENLLIPSYKLMFHTLYLPPKLGRYYTIASKAGQSVLPSNMKAEENMKWDLNAIKGLTFLLSWPLLKTYKEPKQGFGKIVQLMYLTMKKSMEVLPLTPIKIEILELEMFMISDTNNNFFLTKSKGNPWNLSPWLSMQMALLLLNLYPIFIKDLMKMEKEKKKMLTQWYWDSILISMPFIPPHFNMTTKEFIYYYKTKNLSPEMAVLPLLTEYFSQDNDKTQEYYENLQVILLMFNTLTEPEPGYNMTMSKSPNNIMSNNKIIASITKSDISEHDSSKIEKLVP